VICGLSYRVVRSCVEFYQCVVPRSSVLWMIPNYFGNAGLNLLVPECNSCAFAPLFLKLVALICLSLKHKSRRLLLEDTNCFGLPKLSPLVSKS